MGGPGSGRPYGSKQFGRKSDTEHSLPLDVRRLQRAGSLCPGVRSSWNWYTRGTDPAKGASIGCLAQQNGVQLQYSHSGEPVAQDVAIEWTPCHFGGSRPWWRCPACKKPVAVIYGVGKLFACRHCYDLCYQVQQESPNDRLLRRAWKIRERLGQRDGGHFDPMPPKPKGMHWSTYERLVQECSYVEALDLASIAERFGWGK